jgi:hypothetical protein
MNYRNINVEFSLANSWGRENREVLAVLEFGPGRKQPGKRSGKR